MRTDLYNNALRPLATFLFNHNVETIYVDGSYVEDTLFPNDIDTFFEVTQAEFRTIFPGTAYTTWQAAQKDNKSDAYACITDLKPYHEPLAVGGKEWGSHREYWDDLFGHTRRGRKPKGFVSIKTRDLMAEVAV
jgi:hypothetical protein